jgi:hypothetical protein
MALRDTHAAVYTRFLHLMGGHIFTGFAHLIGKRIFMGHPVGVHLRQYVADGYLTGFAS